MCINGTTDQAPVDQDVDFVLPLQVNYVSFTLGSAVFAENVIALVTIISCTKMTAQIKLLSINLTITDLMTGLTMFIDSLFPSNITELACRALHVAYATFVAVSFLTITSFAVDRWFALRFAMRYQALATTSRLKTFICCLWICGHALAYLIHLEGFQNYYLCLQRLIHGSMGLMVASIVFNSLLLFNLYLYVDVYVIVRRQSKFPASLDKVMEKRMFSLHIRVMRKICGITLPFICLYSPNIILNSCILVSELHVCESNVFVYSSFAGTLVFINSFLNPFLYICRYTECRYKLIRWCCFWNKTIRTKYTRLQKLYFAEYLTKEHIDSGRTNVYR